MVRSPLLPLVFTLLLVACGDSGPKDDVGDVRTCYENYFDALRRADGPTAAQLVDTRTAVYYTSMLELARNADSAQVAGLDMMDKLTVLGMRMRGSPEQLRGMDGRDAIALAVDAGMMGSNGIEGLELGAVTVEGDKARAPLTMHGFPTPAVFEFHREQGEWRIDLTSLFNISRMAFGQMAGGAGKSEQELIHELLEQTAGMPVPQDVWHPMR